MIILGARRYLSLKNCQVCPQNSFSQFSWKILLFWKNYWKKNIQHLIYDKKSYIHSWCKITPYKSRTVTLSGCVANKVRVDLYFYIPKYHSSDAFPALEIYFFICTIVKMEWLLWDPQHFCDFWDPGLFQDVGVIRLHILADGDLGYR